jgi:hypothetical protein
MRAKQARLLSCLSMESIMKTLPLVGAIAIFAFSSAALAQGGQVLKGGLTQAQINDITAGMGPTNSSHLVSSPAECQPQMAEAVWGPGGQLAGYSCYENANGG